MIATTDTLEQRQLDAKMNQLLTSYLESQISLWDSYVDPREALLGPDGEIWGRVGDGMSPIDEPPYRTDTELDRIRAVCRVMSQDNEFAINGHENRISYIVGWGHTYNVVSRDPNLPAMEAITAVKAFLDDWLERTRWGARQQENQLRADRDGEVLLRTFRAEDGYLRIRYIEPANLRTPNGGRDHQAFGVETIPGDIESVVQYWVDGKPVPACDVQHRKYNLDSSHRRGLPMFWPVRFNLQRARKILRNMSMATEIQNAIALIRKHQTAQQQAVRSFISAKGVGSVTDPVTQQQRTVLQYPPGSILDAPAGTEYTYPSGGIDPSKTVSALQAELRAVASRVVMPEFMLTSDASNANYSSTMVAEGPAVKKFERDQQSTIEFDLAIINKALEYAAVQGLIKSEHLALVKVTAEAPSVQVRDGLKEAQQAQILGNMRYLSPQTGCAKFGLDYETEQTNLELHDQAHGSGGIPLPGLGGGLPKEGLPEAPSSLQATALNGAQIASLAQVAAQIAAGQMPAAAGKVLLRNAFPMIPAEEIDLLITSMQS